MEIGAINIVIRNLVGMAELEDLVLEYARKAVALLQPSDSATLQRSTLKSLASALRKARKIDESKAMAEVRSLEDRIAKLSPPADGKPARADEVKPTVKKDQVPWSRNFAAARKEAKAKGKLILVDFYTQTCGWCKRLDADVFPTPAVAEAMRPFVPVKVDAEDGEGRPLAERYRAHIQGYPAILFLDPAIDDPKDGRIVGKIPGFMPPGSFVEQLNTIAQLPRDIGKLQKHHKTHPEDGDSSRQLATALAMQGRSQEAIELASRAAEIGKDPNFDRWAAVYNTIADEIMLRLPSSAAAEWYNKAARVAKRPIDVYNARLGAGFVAAMQAQRGPGRQGAGSGSPGCRCFEQRTGVRPRAAGPPREADGRLGVRTRGVRVPTAPRCRRLPDVEPYVGFDEERAILRAEMTGLSGSTRLPPRSGCDNPQRRVIQDVDLARDRHTRGIEVLERGDDSAVRQVGELIGVSSFSSGKMRGKTN